ncbi:MAG: hypothetical protein ACKKL4_00055 [Patescibacteria group bacterium]
MAYTLIINPGSSSRKYALADDEALVYSAHAALDEAGKLVLEINTAGKQEKIEIHSLEDALGRVLESVLSRSLVPDLAHIQYVVFRIVAPGSAYTTHQYIDDSYIAQLASHTTRAPLHIPPLYEEIIAVQDFFPDALLYAISDSAFHTTITEHLARLSVDAQDAQKYNIRRFGYHGISASSVVRQLQANNHTTDSTVVVHFGGGISIHAIDGGVSVNTSMGYDPSGGMMMSSRGGDVSAGAMLALAQEKKMSLSDAQAYLYTQCGFEGIVGERDMRRVLEKYEAGDADALLVIEKLRFEIQSQIAAYTFQMGGISQLVLTGTAFYRNPILRDLMLRGLESQGFLIDDARNNALEAQPGTISAHHSQVAILVLPADETNEMLALFRENAL